MSKEQDKKELSGDELEGSSRQVEISEEALEGVSGRGAAAMKGPLRKLSTVVDATGDLPGDLP
ncbi:hypothetical protein RS9916_32277 [Synechococcus sp. RS9916]|nr:hypothetical protein RS9916_32277 [Synechococcus sp. RS9916]